MHEILLVEDNPDARETLRLLLELDGHRVAEADTGERGIALALEQPFSVALIDIGLPDVDGYHVAQRIRSASAGDRVVLVALTGYGRPEDVRRAREAGFDAHVVKPVDPRRPDEDPGRVPPQQGLISYRQVLVGQGACPPPLYEARF